MADLYVATRDLTFSGRDVSGTLLAADEESEASLASSGMDFITLKDVISVPDFFEEIRTWTQAVRSWGRHEIGGCAIENMFVHDGLPFWKILETGIVSPLASLSGRTNTLGIIRAMTKLIREECPGRVVSEGSSLPGKIVAAVARANGIPFQDAMPKKRSLGMSVRGAGFDLVYRYLNRGAGLKRRITGKRGSFSRNRGRVLVIPLIQTTLPTLKPVLDRLLQDGSKEVMVLRYDLLRPRMQRDMERMGISFIDMDTFSNRASRKRAAAMSKALKVSWSAVRKDARARDIFTMDGIGLFEPIREVMDFFFRGRSRIDEACRYIENMRNIMESERPDIIVGMDESSFIGAPTMMIAKGLGIPTLSIQHGVVVDIGPVTVDRIAVWDPKTRDQMIKNGFGKKQVVVTGCPRYDRMAGDFDSRALKRKLGLGEDEKIIVYATQPSSAKPDYLNHLFSTLSRFDERVVIRMHPREVHRSFYSNIARRNGVEPVFWDGDLYQLFDACELLVVMHSTVAKDAALMDRPVVVFNPIDKEDSTTLVDRGAAIGVFGYSGLEEAIRSALRDDKKREWLSSNRKSYMESNTYKMDGRSSERIIGLMESMMHRSKDLNK